jgi:glycosyltransferase involved in cell wall biosynthesis
MNEKLKIVFFHNLGEGGGAKRVLYSYVKYLKDNGHMVDVLVPETAYEDTFKLKDICDYYKEFPVKESVIRKFLFKFMDPFFYHLNISVPRIFKVSFNEMKNTERQIAEYINNEDYDIVFSEQDNNYFGFSPIFLKFVKKPLVYYCQQPNRDDKIINNLLSDASKKSFFKKIINKFLALPKNKGLKRDINHAQYADHILTNSYYTHETILRIYGQNSQVSYLGSEKETFKPLNLNRENFVLSVGNIGASKGYDFIIKSLGHVDRKIRPKLIIVGNVSHDFWEGYLKKLADERDVNVEFLQGVSDDCLIKLYNKAQMVVYAPYLEPFGLIPIEAMACGTPTIGVQEGGIKETVVHGKTGLLTQRDEIKFSQAIEKLLYDDKLWGEMSEFCKVHFLKFWTNNCAGKRLLKHFYRILDDK